MWIVSRGSLQVSGNVVLHELEPAVAEADVVLLLVDHDDFREMDRQLMAGKPSWTQGESGSNCRPDAHTE